MQYTLQMKQLKMLEYGLILRTITINVSDAVYSIEQYPFEQSSAIYKYQKFLSVHAYAIQVIQEQRDK